MTYQDFVDELAAVGISGRELGRLLRLNKNTIANYKSKGEVPSNLAVIVTLMRLLADNEIPYKEKLAGLDIQVNAARGKSISAQ
ncbi:MAG: XRE family transcriptional regulator [Pseudomonadota bacterium]